MVNASKLLSLVLGLGFILGGAFLANKWGDGVVNTAAGLAMIGVGTGMWGYTGWITTQPKFAKKDGE